MNSPKSKAQKIIKQSAKSKELKKWGIVCAIGLGFLLVFGCFVAIALPYAEKVDRCNSYVNIEEVPASDYSACKEQVARLQEKAETVETEEKEKCSAKNYEWNEKEHHCNTDDEQEESTKKKAEEETKKAEAEAKKKEEEVKRAEAEAKKREEESKYVTYTGTDHDANDYAGRYDKLLDACWNKLDSKSSTLYELDSNDGYPITYSVTLSSDGSLVSGSMEGYYMTVHNKVMKYRCTYSNGIASLPEW